MKDDKHVICSQVIVNNKHLKANQTTMMSLVKENLASGLVSEIEKSKIVSHTAECNYQLEQTTFKAKVVILSLEEYAYYKRLEGLYNQLLEGNYL